MNTDTRFSRTRSWWIYAGILLHSAHASALEAEDLLLFTWGPLTLKPQLAFSETFNDNLFSATQDQVSDLTSTLSPGLGLLLGKKSGNYLTLNYTLNQHFYADRSDLDATEHVLDLTSFIEGERLELRGNDRFQILSSPLGNEVRAFDQQVQDRPVNFQGSIGRTTLYDNYTLSYRFSERTAIYLRGAYSVVDYEPGIRLFDLTTYSGAAGFAFRARSKTVLFGEGYLGHSETTPNLLSQAIPDLTFTGGILGARGNFTDKINGTISAGLETREFADGESIPATPVVNLNLGYAFSPKTAFSLNYTRRQDVSIQYSKISYVSEAVGLSVNQALGTRQKWRANLGGYYSIYDYGDAARFGAIGYSVYSVNFNLAYQIRLWLTASLGYDRTGVLSDAGASSSYDVNRVTLRIAAGY